MDDLRPHRRVTSDIPEPSRVAYPGQLYMQGDDEITLVDIWRVISRYKWLILLGTLLATMAAATGAYLMTPYYRAEVVMVPALDEKSGNLSLIQRNLGNLVAPLDLDIGGARGNREWMVATLKSRAFTEDFIKDEGIMPVIYSEKWDERNQRWQLEPGEKTPTLWKAYNAFNENIRSVEVDRATGLITLGIEWKDPVLAAAWANDMVERLNRRLQGEAIRDAEESIAYLKEQAETTGVVELRQAIYRLIENQVKKTMLANVSDEYAFKVIDPARVPENPVRPRPMMMIVLGFMLGLLGSLFIAFVAVFVQRQRQAAQSREDTA